jgi:glyoxylase I family protein
MSARFTPQFVDHLVFYVQNVARSRDFYEALLGPAVQASEEAAIFSTGDTRIFFVPAAQTEPAFDKQRIGLNHLAFGVRTLDELGQIEQQLNSADIHHSGIQIDRHGGKEYIWIDDPDGFRVEFYLRPLA